DEPGLRTAEQLVARERHHVGPGREYLRRRRLVLEAERRDVDEGTTAEVLDQRHAVTPGECGQLACLRARGEATDPEIARMDPQHRADVLVTRQRALVVAQVRAVRGADLEQPGAALLQDLGHAERAADLDQLTARD